MRWLFVCFLAFSTIILEAQTSNKDSDASQRPTFQGAAIGMELTAFAEEYNSFRLSYVQGFTSTDLLDLDLDYVSDGSNKTKIEGFSSTLQYKKVLLIKSIYLGAGAKYMTTNHNEDIILRRLNSAFFQEFEVNQKREAIFGVVSFGGLVQIDDRAFIDFEYQLLFGTATYERIQGIPPGSELVQDFDQDRRLVYTTIADQSINLKGALNFNLTFSFRL